MAVVEDRFRPGAGELLRDAVHRRQRAARHPREPRGGPPRASCPAPSSAASTTPTRCRSSTWSTRRTGWSLAVFVDGVRLDVARARWSSTSARWTCATALLYPAHRVRGRRGPPDPAGDAALREHGRPPARARCASRSRPENHDARDRRRERRSTASGATSKRLPVYPDGHRSSTPRDALGEVGARQAHATRSTRSDRRRRSTCEMRTHRHRRRPRLRAPRPLRRRAGAPRRRSSAASGSTERDRSRRSRRDRAAWTSWSSIGTSRDPDATGRAAALPGGLGAARATAGFDAVVAASRAVWERLWDGLRRARSTATPRCTRAVRFGLYHLLIAANADDPTVNIGAKSLSGEGYRGHVFWDTEIFMLPFFIYTQPDTARSLLRYRYHTLPAARENSREYGSRGARYAVGVGRHRPRGVPEFTVDGANRFWTREEEIHVSADVAYGILTLRRGDRRHRLPARVRRRDPVRDQPVLGGPGRADAGPGGYSLQQVMGPDEFHSHVDNNAFTNRLAQWHLQQAAPCLRRAARPSTPTRSPRSRRDRPQPRGGATGGATSPTRIVCHREPATGVIEQFTGYFERAGRARHRVGREQHAPLPEGLPPLQLRGRPSCSSSPTW